MSIRRSELELYAETSVDGTSVLHMKISALHDNVSCNNCTLAVDLEQLMIMAPTIFEQSINLASVGSVIANSKSLGVSV